MAIMDHLATWIVAVGVLVGLWQSWSNGRSLKVIHKATNSMHDEIVDLARKDATNIERAANVAQAVESAENRSGADEKSKE